MFATYYRVAITTLTGGANGDGFIDHNRIEQYMGAASPTIPTTVANSISKERANIRYDNMVSTLGLLGNLYIVQNVAVGADANTPATSYTFLLISEHGDSVLSTPDELNVGATLTGAAAIKRAIARSFMINNIDFGDYYDPTTTSPDATYGIRIEKVTAGALTTTISAGETAITVTPTVIW